MPHPSIQQVPPKTVRHTKPTASTSRLCFTASSIDCLGQTSSETIIFGKGTVSSDSSSIGLDSLSELKDALCISEELPSVVTDTSSAPAEMRPSELPSGFIPVGWELSLEVLSMLFPSRINHQDLPLQKRLESQL